MVSYRRPRDDENVAKEISPSVRGFRRVLDCVQHYYLRRKEISHTRNVFFTPIGISIISLRMQDVCLFFSDWGRNVIYFQRWEKVCLAYINFLVQAMFNWGHFFGGVETGRRKRPHKFYMSFHRCFSRSTAPLLRTILFIFFLETLVVKPIFIYSIVS